MKKILLFLITHGIVLSWLCAQNTGIGTAIPHASAILDITSSSKGLLIPRMNAIGIGSISNPAKGLLVMDTAASQLMVNMGNPVSPNWQTIAFKSGWNLTGNTNINPATNFIGTTDAQPLQFRVNNLTAGQIHPLLNNTVFGYTALSSNTSGNNNTVSGSYALYYNTTGHDNTATGFYSLYANTTGSSNKAYGNFALYSNTTGSNNTGTGDYALYSNTTGDNNTASGLQALNYNTTGFSNTAIGLASLYSNTTGYSNTAIGNYGLYSNTTGYSNAAYGFQSLYSNTNGASNTANGSYTLYSNTTGYGNTSNGYQSLYYNTNGSNNTASGNAALFSNGTGNNNTAIGANTDVSADDLNDATAIGANAVATASDKVVIGVAYPGTIVIGGYANWSNFSDGRFKENIRDDVPGLSFISKLRPVTYQINNKSLVNHITHLMPDSLARRYKKTDAEYAVMEQKTFTGFVAQEVERTTKQMGYDFDGVNAPRNETDHYSLSYASFVVPLVKAVQEQQTIIEQQNKKIDTLEKRLAALESRISKQ
jgi:hypothetical protein